MKDIETKLDAKTKEAVLKSQKTEMTEHVVYKRLAKKQRGRNAEILEQISEDEARHASIWERYTNTKVRPNPVAVILYSFLNMLFGITFTLKLMELNEDRAQKKYKKFLTLLPDAEEVLKEEEKHEQALLDLIDEERLKYTSSIVLGLNDALVELTGTLAGLTFALANSRIVGLAGLITGIAASLSMAASEYLSQKSEERDTHPLRASVYTGVAYIITVALLIFPFFVSSSVYAALAWSLINALIIIALFTFFVSVVRSVSFKPMFTEMALVSFGVAAISFVIGSIANKLLGGSL
ncbi:Predicted Fe2+/Mn2+ transporter, VIT1/CCC1 family [Acetomicrobium thermoterrenum DSM 13490]|uniref:Predicted Fe2+/Mn2+ transporter, VIT1/CCC1 family n=1 Tax=Acetomicrobium thermoterrenum DSM 13490 TaxID=1120987 RepID=A0A1H3FUW3_9BACT|nr:VIT1/CCC1 transporter family protein [Acetomicrobium thermoterrenum]SDX93944.1 Predicted Fe2+/Mn2+ transporter, VIT1/CCC1 family [Acetomicrobium thermoterrenum DSM 13490]